MRTVQSDGITAHKRLRGVNFNTRLLGFRKTCLYKLSKNPKDKGLEGKLGVRWKEGVFLGYSRDSNEFIIWSIPDKTVLRACSLQRKSESTRWSASALQEANQRPHRRICSIELLRLQLAEESLMQTLRNDWLQRMSRRGLEQHLFRIYA